MTSFAECIVQVGGEAVRVPASEIHRIGQASESFRKVVALFDLSLLAQAQQSTACQALHQVESRAARWLLQCSKRLGSNDIRLTQEFFAQMLGVQRTTINLVERTLQHAGLIQIGRGRISILDVESLHAVSCDCYDRIERRYEELLGPPQAKFSLIWRNNPPKAVFAFFRSVGYPTVLCDCRPREPGRKAKKVEQRQPKAGPRPVVLIVEDEFLVRMDAIEVIEGGGFEVVEAKNADEAIAILERRNDIALIFTDIDMPGSMDGLKLSHFVKGRWPPIKIIATSGHTKITANDLPEGVRFMPKPYKAAEVADAIHQLIQAT